MNMRYIYTNWFHNSSIGNFLCHMQLATSVNCLLICEKYSLASSLSAFDFMHTSNIVLKIYYIRFVPQHGIVMYNALLGIYDDQLLNLRFMIVFFKKLV